MNLDKQPPRLQPVIDAVMAFAQEFGTAVAMKAVGEVETMAQAEVDRLNAEIERLRAALEEIALIVRSDEHGELPAGAHFAVGAVRKVILAYTLPSSDGET